MDMQVMTQQQQQQQQHGDIFTAEQLLGKRRKRGQLEYLVQWKGFSNEHNTWEPRENILDPELIRDFNDRMRGSRKSRRSPKSPKHLQHHQMSHDKRRFTVETALRRTVDALWHQMMSSDKPRHMSTDSTPSSLEEMTSYYEAGLRGHSTGSSSNCSSSSSSSSASTSGDASPVRLQPPTLSPHYSHCSTVSRHSSLPATAHYEPPSPSVGQSAPSLHSPAVSEATYYTPDEAVTSLPVTRQTSLEDVERFVSTPYWRYSPHRMPPKKRWLVCELLSSAGEPVSPVNTVHDCHHTFPICHFTNDKLARRA